VNGGTNVNGQNALTGVNGPFFATAAVGGTVAFTWSGPPNADVILVMGPLHRNNVVFPGTGSLDLGLLGPASIADVLVLLDGLSDATFLDTLATTGPFGTSTMGFTVPSLPPGVAGAFQAGVVPAGQPPVLTAAFELTIN